MQVVYHTNTEELTVSLFEKIKNQFKNAKIDIFIQETEDTTDYLNSSKANKKYLDEAIQEVQNRKTINKSLSDLDL